MSGWLPSGEQSTMRRLTFRSKWRVTGESSRSAEKFPVPGELALRVDRVGERDGLDGAEGRWLRLVVGDVHRDQHLVLVRVRRGVGIRQDALRCTAAS